MRLIKHFWLWILAEVAQLVEWLFLILRHKRLDMTLIRFLMKLFKLAKMDIINDCLLHFKVSLPCQLIQERKEKFMSKFPCCRSLLWQIIRNWVYIVKMYFFVFVTIQMVICMVNKRFSKHSVSIKRCCCCGTWLFLQLMMIKWRNSDDVVDDLYTEQWRRPTWTSRVADRTPSSRSSSLSDTSTIRPTSSPKRFSYKQLLAGWFRPYTPTDVVWDRRS